MRKQRTKEQKPRSFPSVSRPTAYASLVELCEEQGLTIRLWAEKHGLNHFALSKWGRRHRKPRLEKAVFIQKITNGRVRAIDWD